MAREMKRGKAQVIWKFLPGSIFRYGGNGAWCRTLDVTLENVTPLSGALRDLVGQFLRRWDAIGLTGFPDVTTQSHKYEVGEPYEVSYDLWPLTFACRKCKRVRYYRDANQIKENNSQLKCADCRTPGDLRQTPFGYVCACGAIDNVFIPRHDQHPIYLVNKFSFRDSGWLCKICGHDPRGPAEDGFGIRPCTCPKRYKSGVLLGDAMVYYSQTAAMVDMQPPALLEAWQRNHRFDDLLLAAVLKLRTFQPSHFRDLVNWIPTKSGLSPELRAVEEKLRARGWDSRQVKEFINEAATDTQDPWRNYDSDLQQYRGLFTTSSLSGSRQTVEYVFVRHDPSILINFSDLSTAAKEAGDLESIDRWHVEEELAANLGIVNLGVIQELPVVLAGVGYTRYRSVPSEGNANEPPIRLNPYLERDGKFPIYVARNTTEALVYELDPWRHGAFLSLNTQTEIPKNSYSSLAAMRAWILCNNLPLLTSGESHFDLTTFERNRGMQVNEMTALSFGLLHTISHVLKATAHTYVGIDSDGLSEYLFPGHASGLLYVSKHVDFTLGGIDAVFRSNLRQWITSIRDFATLCSFDPVCNQSGGACLACLYTKFGCSYFNRTLSRVFLTGGELKGRSEPIIGYWDSEVISLAKSWSSQVGK